MEKGKQCQVNRSHDGVLQFKQKADAKNMERRNFDFSTKANRSSMKIKVQETNPQLNKRQIKMETSLINENTISFNYCQF